MDRPISNALSKTAIRLEVLSQRRAIENRSGQNEAIRHRLWQNFPLQPSQRCLIYVGVRDEVPTLDLLQDALQSSNEVVVPYCLPNQQLGLFSLRDLSELKAGAYGIFEPDSSLRAERLVEPKSLDLAILPGVAFDLRGNRLGYGKGYFDRLLVRLRPDCRRIALAYECQLVPEVPIEPHDIPAQRIVTPQRTIICPETG